MKQKLPLLLFFLHVISFGYAQSSASDSLKAREMRSRIENGHSEISNYNTACYFALAGDRVLALSYLKKAVYDDGFSNFKNMENDTDLASLHADPAWGKLLKLVADNDKKATKDTALLVNKPSFWESAALKTPYRENLSVDEKVAGLSKFWSEAKYNFVNFDLVPRLNFDSLYFAYLPRVRETKSTLDFYRVMTEFCAHLKDGHTNINAPKELINEVYPRPLFRSRLVEDKVLIVGVYDDALVKKGIEPGQEIITVNNMPVKEYALKYVMPYQSASTPQDQETRTYEYALFSGAIDEPIQLQLKDKSGKITTHTVNRAKLEDRSAKMTPPAFEYKLLKENIAYIALNTCANDSAAKAFATNYAAISKASAIIFDVRNNGGGSSSVGLDILSYLIDHVAPTSSWYTRAYNPSYRAWNRQQHVFGGLNTLQANGKFYYSKPVVVLTSSRTYSAAEDFATAFKSLNRGLIIGQATGGSSGQPLPISLPGNLSARICTKHDRLANGDDFVGKGVQPDKLVVQTVADVRKGIDTELEAAISQLMK